MLLRSCMNLYCMCMHRFLNNLSYTCIVSILISKNNLLDSQRASIINQNIELVGIINKRGRMTESLGLDSFDMPDSKKEMFLMKIALRTSMQKDFDDDLGEVNYCMTQRGHKKFISIPAPDNNTILIITKNDFKHEGLIKNIIQTIEDSDQFLGVFFKGVDL